MTSKILMNINEVHWNFSDNGTKEPAKTLFWNICNFWTVWNFLMQFSPLCSGEWALSFYTWVIIFKFEQCGFTITILFLQKQSDLARSTMFDQTT